MRRLALLVATYRYQDTGLRQLTAPGHDAEALAGVLRQPNIANFDVTILVNEPHYVVGSVIGEFYRNRRRDDLTLLYFTGHGLKDDEGRLYLAMTDTKRDDLLFTALSAQQIDDAMNSCPSRQKVLILDCCYSGAFPVGRISKAGTEVHTLEKFQGRGRVVLTASDATQYSLEGNKIFGKGTGSVFTRFLVEGIETGKGDLDGDGDISLDELYSYVYDRVIEEIPQQRPKKQENIEGRIVVARNIHWSLPAYLRNAIESPIVTERLDVLDHLVRLHRNGNDMVRADVINHIRHLTNDDNKVVSAAAITRMETLDREQAPREFVPELGKAMGTQGIPRTWPRRRILGWSAGVLLLTVIGTAAIVQSETVMRKPSPSALPQTRAAVPRGKLIYQAVMDGTGKSFIDLVGRNRDPSQASVTFKPGALELAALTKDADAGTDLKLGEGVTTFIGDIELSVKPGSDVKFYWSLRWAVQGKLAYELGVDTAAQFAQLAVWNDENHVPISPRIDVTALQSGRIVPMTVVVENTHLTLYMDGQKATDVEDHQVPVTHSIPGLDVYSGDGTGTVLIHGVHLYQLTTE